MGRIQGLSTFAANFEVEKRASLDARMNVDTKADLLLTTTWEAHDGNEYTYIGMAVVVSNDGANNGIYILQDTDYTQESNWKYIGSTDVYIDADPRIERYIDFVNGDDSADGLSRGTAFLTLEGALATPYNGFVDFFTSGDWTIDDNAIALIRKNIGAFRFRGKCTELATGIDTTMVDKFDYTTTQDLGTNDYSDAFIGLLTSFGVYQGYPIRSNTANTLEISHTVALSSTQTTIFRPDDNLVISVKNIDTDVLLYLLNYNISFLETRMLARSWFRPSYCNIDMAMATYGFGKMSGLSSYNQLYSVTGCRVINIGNQLFYNTGGAVYNSILKGNGVSRFFYGGLYAGGGRNIVEDAADVIRSSRSWKLTMGRNYGIRMYNVTRFGTVSSQSKIQIFNYESEGWALDVNNVDYLFNLATYQDGTGATDIIISINTAIQGVLNSGYVYHGALKKYKYMDISNNIAINIAGTHPEYTHNSEVTLANNSNGNIVVGNSDENVVCNVKYSAVRGSIIAEGTISILTNGTIIDNNQTLQQTAAMGLTLSSVLNGTDIELVWTTTDAVDDIVMDYVVERRMKF